VVPFATNDPHAVMAAWARPTPGVKVKVTHEVRLGQPVSNFITFRNCRADRQGLCEVTAEWELVDPSGRRALTAKSRVRVGLPPLSPGTVGMSTESADFTFAAPDPPGRYVLRARTTDHIAGVTLQTQDTLLVRR